MATGNDTTPTTDESTRDFYPEDAADINFEQARVAAEQNAQADAQAKIDAENADEKHDSIPAQPEVSESTNPEQVKVEEPSDETAPTEEAPAAAPTATTDTAA